jgi:hypothetical protein
LGGLGGAFRYAHGRFAGFLFWVLGGGVLGPPRPR